MLRAAFIVLFIALLPAHALAESRIALLIGNQVYNPKVGPLKNPHDDVALVGAALRSLGFTVTELMDADYRSMDAAIKRQAGAVRREGPGTISLLYYSGHGAADPDTKTNYLIPVDVADAADADLWNYSLNLNNIIEGLRAHAPAATHYVVFDACRNELNLTRKGKKALTDKGFVPLAYMPGVMVAYATAPGRTAADTGSGGGPYAKALSDEIVKPGIEAMTMFRRVALRVNREIGQDPWMSASTLPEIYFAGSKPPGPTPEQQYELAFWASVKDSTSPTVLNTYLERYPSGEFAPIARALMEHYEQQRKAEEAAREEEHKRREEALKAAEVRRLEEERRIREAALAEERRRAEDAKNATEAKRAEERERKELVARTEQLRKALEEARIAREAAHAAEEQRLAAIKAVGEATKAAEQVIETKREEETMSGNPTKVAALPNIEQPSTGAFDGAWTITRIGEKCFAGRIVSFSVSIVNRSVGGGQGSVSASGTFKFQGRSKKSGRSMYYTGKLGASSGSGEVAPLVRTIFPLR
jgi:uncharacterized caspase-like protein